MNFFSSNKPPSFLDSKNRRGNTEDQRNVQAATGGDLSKFKLNHIMVSRETIREIDTCMKGARHGTEYMKMFSAQYHMRRPELPEFVSVCKKHDVVPYIGGGATEEAIRDGDLTSYVKDLHRLGIDTIEVSNGGGDIPACQSRHWIANLRKDFRRVLVEIGSKSSALYRTRDEWHRDLDAALDADADAVILEGTGAGNSGIYERTGGENALLVTGLMNRAGDRKDRFLVEAPIEGQRHYWMSEMFGWNVRLGNMSLDAKELQKNDRMRLDAMKPAEIGLIEARRRLHQEFLEQVLLLCRKKHINADRIIFDRSLHHVRAQQLTDAPDWKTEVSGIIDDISAEARLLIISISPEELAQLKRFFEM